MRRAEPWLIAISLVGGLLAATPQAHAQQGTRTPVDRNEHDRRRPPQFAPGPREAPPAPRDERVAARAGFVWQAGRWDWRNGKWEWQAGRWETERAGKQWNAGRWERKGDLWVYEEGGWVDVAHSPPIIAPGGPGNEPREAPPTPREERQAARAGFEWIQGRWEWRNGKWDWSAGRWEKERPGKHWNAGRWDKQGDRWVYVDGTWTDGGPTPPGNDRPRTPPPPPRDERPGARPGYVYAKGHWDWRGGKWDWQAGRWETDRPGQQWREARWELRDGTYAMIDGEWVNVGPPSGQPLPPAGNPYPDRRTWRLERPTVSSYWPIKGKIGSRITIRGRNFPSDTAVLWGGTQVNGARVTADEITVAVPPGATSGTLLLRAGGRRELIVGNYEVAADYDAAAEAARLAEEARAKAEREWLERQRVMAKDRATRLAAYERHRQELDQTREQRREMWLSQLRARWEAAFLADTETQDELTLHAQRSADLSRMREVAELSENGKLVIRVGVAQSREDERHTTRMAALHDSFGRKP